MELFNQDGLTQTELVQRIDVEQPTAVRTLDRMERDGFIHRQPSPLDRRAVLIYLSEKGKQTEPMLAENARRLNDLALQGFSEAEKTSFRP